MQPECALRNAYAADLPQQQNPPCQAQAPVSRNGQQYVPHVNGVKCSAVNSNLHMHIIQHPEPFVNEKHIYVPY